MAECEYNEQRRADGEFVSDRRERALSKELAYFSMLALQYNLGDRAVKVQETKLRLLLASLTRALRHPDIDLSPDKIRQVPAIMQAELRAPRDQGPHKLQPVIPRPPDEG